MSIKKSQKNSLKLKLRRGSIAYGSVDRIMDNESFANYSSTKSIDSIGFDTNYNKKLFPTWLENQEEFK